jgi:hypothetical protein
LDAWVHLNPHLIWQATKSYLERGDAFWLVTHECSLLIQDSSFRLVQLGPDPTFHASPKLAMEAPPENFAYTLLLSPDFSKPDALAVIDTKPGSPTFSQIVHR